MDDLAIRGTKEFRVPEYFNFADVVDEWARKEKVMVITFKYNFEKCI